MKNRTSFQMYSVLLLMLGLTLSACQKAGQSKSSPGHPATPASPALPGGPNGSATPEMDGTGDVGGGNGINGRMLESYRQNVTELEAFKKIIKPKFDAMDEIDRKSGNRTNPESSTKNLNFKTWYIAPLKFKIINNNVLGLSFSDDRTEQLAAQTQREIWINKEAYEKMDLQHQADLIMHELFMAYYMMKFESGENLCKMLMSDKETFSCENLNGPLSRPPEPSRNLIDDDYSRIRAATVWFMSQGPDLTSDMMTAKMHRLGFDKRFGGSEDGGPKFEEDMDRQITMKEAFARVQQGLQNGLFQPHCETNMDGLPQKFKCQLDLDLLSPAKDEKGNPVTDTLTWRLKSEKTINGYFLVNSTAGANGGISGTSYRIAVHDISSDHTMLYLGVVKAGSKYYEVRTLTKKTTPSPKQLKVELIGILFVERVFFGMTKYNYNGAVHSCPTYSSVLNEKGEKSYILLKAKKGYDERVMVQFEDWIYDPDCDQTYAGGTRI